MKGIQTERLLPEGEAQQLHFKEDIQLSLTDVSVSLRVGFKTGRVKMNSKSGGLTVKLCRTPHTGWRGVPQWWHRLLQHWRRPQGPRRGQRRGIGLLFGQPGRLDSSLQAPFQWPWQPAASRRPASVRHREGGARGQRWWARETWTDRWYMRFYHHMTDVTWFRFIIIYYSNSVDMQIDKVTGKIPEKNYIY